MRFLKIFGVLGGLTFLYGSEPFKLMTTFPTDVLTTSATLRGQVTSYGQVNQCRFNVSVNGGAATKTSTVTVPAAIDVADVKQSVTGLAPNAFIVATLECVPPGTNSPVVGSSYSFVTSSGASSGKPNVTFNAANIVTMGSPGTAGISPYALVSIFGGGLATQTLSAPTSGFPTNLGGTSVSFGGIPGYVRYVSPSQIDVLVPPDIPALASMTVQVSVDAGGGNIGSASGAIQTQTTSPGILGYQDLAGNNLVNVGQLLLPTNGKWYVTVYGTGFGLASPIVAGQPARSDPLAALVHTPSVNFIASDGLLTVQKVIWSGLAPGQIGVDQVNVEIAGVVAPGAGTLQIIASDGHTIAIPINLGSQ